MGGLMSEHLTDARPLDPAVAPDQPRLRTTRRGPAPPYPQRHLGEQLQQAILNFATRLTQRDWARPAIADLLGLPRRTLRYWQQHQRPDGRRVGIRGRPTLRSPWEQRRQVLE